MVLFICRIFVALCRSQKLPCDVSANVCEGLATGSRHMRWLGNSFVMIFVAKKYYMFKTFGTCSRPVHYACEDFAMPCERLATFSRIDSQNSRELVASQWNRGLSIPTLPKYTVDSVPCHFLHVRVTFVLLFFVCLFFLCVFLSCFFFKTPQSQWFLMTQFILFIYFLHFI